VPRARGSRQNNGQSGNVGALTFPAFTQSIRVGRELFGAGAGSQFVADLFRCWFSSDVGAGA